MNDKQILCISNQVVSISLGYAYCYIEIYIGGIFLKDIVIEKESYASIGRRDEVVECYYKDRNRKIDILFNELKQIPAIASFIQEVKDGNSLKVILSKADLKMLKDNKYHLKRYKKGFIMPLLFDENNRKIEKQIQLDYADLDIFTSIDRIIIQKQLSEIVNKLQDISDVINKILRGQQNDRIGLAESAKYQYIEAMTIDDSYIKQGILINVIKTAHDARAQLIENLKDDVKEFLEIPDRQFDLFIKQLKNKNYENEVYELVHDIHRSYEYINLTSGILALSYTELGQPQNIELSFQPYKKVLNYFHQQYRLFEKLSDTDDRPEMEKIWRTLPYTTLKTVVDIEKELTRLSDKENNDNIILMIKE